MFKSKLFMLFVIPVIISLAFTACGQSEKQEITATPIEVPKEGNPGEYISVIMQTSSLRACKLVLSTPHKTEIDNYLFPYTNETQTIPNSDGKVVFREQIPHGTAPGSYVLRVIQMRYDGDTEGSEILSQTFIIH